MTEPLRQGSRAPVAGLDMERIESASDQLRALLMRLCPNLVQTAEAIGHEVRYLPVSALGKTPETRPGVLRPSATGGDPGMPVEFIRPRDIRPAWVTVPFLYGLARFVSKLIPKAERKESREKRPPAENLVPPPISAPAEPKPPAAPKPEPAPKVTPIDFDFDPEDLK
jgi:hypothetical protein